MASSTQNKLSPADLIEMANRRTERRGKTLDLPSELVICVQEICVKHRWHWRKKSISFPTVAGQAVYDLTEVPDMNGLTIERACGGYVKSRWQGPKIFDGSGNGGDLTPIFDTDTQELVRQSTEQGRPGQYFFDGQDQFRVTPIPVDASYTIRIPAWMLPDSSPMEDTVTLVPAYLYPLVIKRLEMQIFRFTLGEGNAKYVAAKAEYEQGLFDASMSMDFAEGRVREWTSEEESIQST